MCLQLKGSAWYRDGTAAETNIDLKITVDDENDCPPVVKVQQVGAVKESSAAGIAGGNQQRWLLLPGACPTSAFWSLSGTVVMKVIATDADQKGTANSRISYKIASESNPDGLFYINPKTGEVMVQQTTLDREVRHATSLHCFFLWSRVTVSYSKHFHVHHLYIHQ